MPAAERRNLRAVPEAPSRAGAYVRVSDVHGRSGERFMSPDQQTDAIGGLCSRSGWEVVQSWADYDRTGRTFHREGIQAAVEAIEAGQIDALVVYDCSRLGRNTSESLAVIQRIRAAGGTFASVAEQIDDSPSGQLALTMFLALAQHVSDTMSVRWRDTHQRVFEQGRHHGPAPLGYRKADQPGVWEEDPMTSGVVRAAFDAYAAGASIYSIRNDVSRARGKPTDRNIVRAMLANPTYIGLVRLNGDTRRGRNPALIEAKVWEKVQRRLQVDRTTPKRRVSATWSLSGIAVCDSCSRTLGKHVVAGRRNGVHVFCRSPAMPDDPRCPGIGRPNLDALEDEVRRQVRDYGRRLRDDVDTRLARQARQTTAKVDAGSLRRDLSNLIEAKERDALDWALRVIPKENHDSNQRRLTASMEAIRSRLAELEETMSAPTITATTGTVERLDRLWVSMTPEERQAAVRAAGVIEVRVRPPTIRNSPKHAHNMTDRVTVRFR